MTIQELYDKLCDEEFQNPQASTYNYYMYQYSANILTSSRSASIHLISNFYWRKTTKIQIMLQRFSVQKQRATSSFNISISILPTIWKSLKTV